VEGRETVNLLQSIPSIVMSTKQLYWTFFYEYL